MYKKCSKCLIHKPLDDFHVLKSAKLGRHPQCKICRKSNKLKKNIYENVEEICCYCCGILKNKNEFYKNKSSTTGRQIYCKDCHRMKITKSMSKIENFLKLILKKFKKKHKNKRVNITVKDLLNILNIQNGKCYITGHTLTSNVDMKQRTDNIWNISIMLKKNDEKMVNVNSINLVCNLVYSSKELYKLNETELKCIYSELK